MKAVCVSNFNYYNKRIQYIQGLLEKSGYDVHYITGDYDTMNRQVYQLDIPNSVQLPLIQYRKNISLQRIQSHYQFAKAMYQQLERLRPDVIYAMVPPNFVAYFVAKYKRKYPQTKIVYDVFDMWPETFPSTYKKGLFLPFSVWQAIRTNGFKQADLIFTECQFFENYLLQKQPELPLCTLYPCQESSQTVLDYQELDGMFGICYLGSINNIIDIDKIEELLSRVSKIKKIALHIIGNGEKLDEFVTRMQSVCQRVEVHGNVYDTVEKQRIFNQCAFGLNILKPTVFIGLTLKTIDYFNGGLPILNNVGGDTQYFVQHNNCGIHINDLAIEDVIAKLGTKDIVQMKINTREVFQRYFNVRDFEKRVKQLMEKAGVIQ